MSTVTTKSQDFVAELAGIAVEGFDGSNGVYFVGSNDPRKSG
jgi:hypothetical protein